MIKGSEIKKADHPIEPLLLDRWSPRAKCQSGSDLKFRADYVSTRCHLLAKTPARESFRSSEWLPSANPAQRKRCQKNYG
jgi:hypothetical protein